MVLLLRGPETELEGTREWKLSWMGVGEPDEALKGALMGSEALMGSDRALRTLMGSDGGL